MNLKYEAKHLSAVESMPGSNIESSDIIVIGDSQNDSLISISLLEGLTNEGPKLINKMHPQGRRKTITKIIGIESICTPSPTNKLIKISQSHRIDAHEKCLAYGSFRGSVDLRLKEHFLRKKSLHDVIFEYEEKQSSRNQTRINMHGKDDNISCINKITRIPYKRFCVTLDAKFKPDASISCTAQIAEPADNGISIKPRFYGGYFSRRKSRLKNESTIKRRVLKSKDCQDKAKKNITSTQRNTSKLFSQIFTLNELLSTNKCRGSYSKH